MRKTRPAEDRLVCQSENFFVADDLLDSPKYIWLSCVGDDRANNSSEATCLENLGKLLLAERKATFSNQSAVDYPDPSHMRYAPIVEISEENPQVFFAGIAIKVDQLVSRFSNVLDRLGLVRTACVDWRTWFGDRGPLHRF